MSSKPTFFSKTVTDKKGNQHNLVVEYNGKKAPLNVLVDGQKPTPENRKKVNTIVAEQFPQLLRR